MDKNFHNSSHSVRRLLPKRRRSFLPVLIPKRCWCTLDASRSSTVMNEEQALGGLGGSQCRRKCLKPNVVWGPSFWSLMIDKNKLHLDQKHLNSFFSKVVTMKGWVFHQAYHIYHQKAASFFPATDYSYFLKRKRWKEKKLKTDSPK